jgi:hypothetical protein
MMIVDSGGCLGPAAPTSASHPGGAGRLAAAAPRAFRASTRAPSDLRFLELYHMGRGKARLFRPARAIRRIGCGTGPAVR